MEHNIEYEIELDESQLQLYAECLDNSMALGTSEVRNRSLDLADANLVMLDAMIISADTLAHGESLEIDS